jgi:hypothetical protein
MLPSLLRCVAGLAAALLPGAAIVLLCRPRAGLTGTVGTALALSPGVAGATIALLVMAGLGWPQAFFVVIALSGLICAVALLLGGARGIEESAAHDPRHVAFVAAGLGVLATGLFPLFSEWWRVSSDAWIHAPIIRSLLTWGLPPRDPWYAGFQLQYAWVYHSLVAGVSGGTGCDPLAFMSSLAVLSLVAVLLLLVHAIQRFHQTRVVFTLAFVTLGFNALFTLFVPLLAARALVGDVRGIREIVRTFDLSPYSYTKASALLHSLGGQDWFLNKFEVSTPFSLALAVYVAWAACMWRWFEAHTGAAGQGHRQGATVFTPLGELVLAAFLTLSGSLIHPVVGFSLLAITLSLAGAALLRFPLRDPGIRRPMLVWLLAVLAGFVPAVPYLRSLLGQAAGQGQLPVDISQRKLVGLFVCLLPGLIFALRAIGPAWRRGATHRIWLVWLLGIFLIALIVKLPGPGIFFTVDKFSYLVWIPLGILAGKSAGDFFMRRSPLLRVLLMLGLFLPVNGFMLLARLADPQASWRQPWDLPSHVWLRSALPPDALLITPPGDVDVCNFMQRNLYYVIKSDALLRNYPPGEIAARTSLVKRLYEDGSLSADERDRLESLGRPVYAVWPDYRGAPWAGRTPGAGYRLMTPAGLSPPWQGSLPVQRFGAEYAVSPLNALAARRFPLPPAGTGAAPEASRKEGSRPSAR